MKPRVAMLSFSNFGSSGELRTTRIEESITMAREIDPDIIIDGPMQADTALVPEQQEDFPFMTFKGPANVLICPSLASANIAYKLLQRLAGAEMTGPILDGLARPAHVLQRGDSVREVVHMAAIYWLTHREWLLRGLILVNPGAAAFTSSEQPSAKLSKFSLNI